MLRILHAHSFAKWTVMCGKCTCNLYVNWKMWSCVFKLLLVISVVATTYGLNKKLGLTLDAHGFKIPDDQTLLLSSTLTGHMFTRICGTIFLPTPLSWMMVCKLNSHT